MSITATPVPVSIDVEALTRQIVTAIVPVIAETVARVVEAHTVPQIAAPVVLGEVVPSTRARRNARALPSLTVAHVRGALRKGELVPLTTDPMAYPCGGAWVVVDMDLRTAKARVLREAGFWKHGTGRLAYPANAGGQSCDRAREMARNIRDALAGVGIEARVDSYLD